ncbi:lipase family protein [Pseudomonas xanthosomatis]|uniref:lipase family protein n=1 Tax=Pseudomonas xanthosomatis TaxID=2842356 RepID=UPI0035137D5C
MSVGTGFGEGGLGMLNSQLLVCPERGGGVTFQLVDESGDGSPYRGCFYEVIDVEGELYSGCLDVEGKGAVEGCFVGPVCLRFDSEYFGSEKYYTLLKEREHYPLKLTELQVCAERTRHLHLDASRTKSNPAQAHADCYYQVEVRELVRHNSHLPPLSKRAFPPQSAINAIMGAHGEWGVGLMPGKHTVLEVRPLRALRPMLSTAPEFCVLNLYQLSLMATLSYSPFGQDPEEHPVMAPSVTFPNVPSMGNWFGEALANSQEIWRVDAAQQQACFPLYEDVPYSERWEIVPFDPKLYSANDPALGEQQENPANIHFLDDRNLHDSTDTQAYITHNAEVMVVAIRGTNELMADVWRDLDALQVPFAEGEGRVHRGFYEAAQRAFGFVSSYRARFQQNQQLIICGHSLGGAVALLLAEMLRRTDPTLTLQLYTYGAPRAGDTSFMQGAADLVHYRMVYDDDPVPSLPAPWMNTRWDVVAKGMTDTAVKSGVGVGHIVSGLINWDGEDFEHHGELRHFLPVPFAKGETSAILWRPGCRTLIDKALCSRVLDQTHGLPARGRLPLQMVKFTDHKMLDSYIPACWATLRRYQQALEAGIAPVSERERAAVQGMISDVDRQLERHAFRIQERARHSPDDALYLHLLREDKRLLKETQQRLDTLAGVAVSEAMVYGNQAGTGQLAEALARWHGHAPNNRAEQMAQAPKEVIDTSPVGRPGPGFDEIMAYVNRPW